MNAKYFYGNNLCYLKTRDNNSLRVTNFTFADFSFSTSRF